MEISKSISILVKGSENFSAIETYITIITLKSKIQNNIESKPCIASSNQFTVLIQRLDYSIVLSAL